MQELKIKQHTLYHYFSQGDHMSFNKFCDRYVLRNLPEEFKHHKGVKRFIANLIIKTPIFDDDLNLIDNKDQYIELYSNWIEDHHKSIYLKSNNQPREKQESPPIYPEKNKSILKLLLLFTLSSL